MNEEDYTRITTLDVYKDMRKAIAQVLAQHAGEMVAAKHYNRATEILWPHLSDDLRSQLVLR